MILLNLSFSQKSFSQIIDINPVVEKARSIIIKHHYAQRITVVACDAPATNNSDPNSSNSAIIMDTQPNK